MAKRSHHDKSIILKQRWSFPTYKNMAKLVSFAVSSMIPLTPNSGDGGHKICQQKRESLICLFMYLLIYQKDVYALEAIVHIQMNASQRSSYVLSLGT